MAFQVPPLRDEAHKYDSHPNEQNNAEERSSKDIVKG
eukprot:CAMPEP_0116104168 /NCGR_PEP_ID=MMETSP0327-20121206/14300_1 /TAXON_ID=44447 /ORGANISM="Pseudo-nitzschia delicatissima, Strain B596" /LENGTH=36 /DNA_ID= /DNA_START= /DNA_END= /DNA_ORIENTATION=